MKQMNRNVIFRDAGMVVERIETPIKENGIAPINDMPTTEITFTVEEGVNILAGYQMSDRLFIELGDCSADCKICGKNINSPQRVICNECDKRYVETIYNGLMAALQKGDKSFKVMINE